MYIIKPTSRFRKDLKKAAKRGWNIDELEEIVNQLQTGAGP